MGHAAVVLRDAAKTPLLRMTGGQTGNALIRADRKRADRDHVAITV